MQTPVKPQQVEISVVDGQSQPVSSSNDSSAVIGQQRTVQAQFSTGKPVATGRWAWVRNTYASQYNFAAKNYDSLGGAQAKKQMRGGRFFLYRYVILFGLAATLFFAWDNARQGGIVTVAVLLCILYTVLGVYNIFVYSKNGSLKHDRMFRVKSKYLTGCVNEFYEIPIRASITDTRILAMVGSDVQGVIANVQQYQQDVDSVSIMVYKDAYLKYMRFPAEAIVHTLLFWIAFGIGLSIGKS